MHKILFPLALASVLPVCAVEYFVDSEGGDDSAAGTSEKTAWKSLDKVNAAAIAPGDVVRFKRGGLWRGSLLPKSGEEGRPVTYTWYGKGPKPILQQSVDRSKPSDWVEVRKGLWATLPTAPEVKEQVWKPSAADEWSPSFQAGYRGKFRKIVENGLAFHRVTLDKRGEKTAPNYLQIWGPRMMLGGDALFVRMQVRSTKPFLLQKVRLMQGDLPYNASHVGEFSRKSKVGAEWSEVTAVLTGGARDFEPRFHFNLGDILPEGGEFDFRLLGVWRPVIDIDRMIPSDVGIFICDHGAKWGVKKWSNPDWVVPASSRWQRHIVMTNDLDYTYNTDEKRVYVVSDRNPGERFESVELAMTRHIVQQGGKHDVVYDGLVVRYGAAHGFGGGNTRNLVIRNCDVYWIGGGLQFWRKDEKTGKIVYPVRFGNGIEFWGTCHNNLVERNRLWECYDAATTNQGRYDDETDITWRDNVIWNSEYSFEYWNARLTRNVTFEHNTCVDAGYGWAHTQRPDINGAHLMYYSNRAATTNFVVRNNIFYRATEWTARSALDWRYGLVHDNNLIWNEGKIPYFRWLDGKNLKLCNWADYLGLGFDPHGQCAEPKFVNPAKRDYRLAKDSPGATLATDGGPVGARNMPGLDEDQSLPKKGFWSSLFGGGN